MRPLTCKVLPLVYPANTLGAIEYKQSPNGSTVKHDIGQSIMHTLSEEFDFVYYLFHDESKDKRIENSRNAPHHPIASPAGPGT